LRRLDAFHQSVVNSVEAALVVLDAQLNVSTWNARAAELWSLRSEDALGRSFFTLPIGDVVKMARPAIEAVLATGRPEIVREVAVNGPRGDPGRVTLRLSRLSGAGVGPDGVVLLASSSKS
jgi:two-component system, chemotaxis family, CheB/CheR fusion protein